MISAREHNKLAAMVRRKTPRYLRLPDLPWPHPWTTRAAWNAEEERWEARVRPGLVNGLDPMVPGVTVPDESYDPKTMPPSKAMRPASLSDAPAIPLHGFRGGFEGISKAARIYFEARGAREIKEDKFAVSDTGVKALGTDTSGQPETYRGLAACDLYLAKSRPSLKGQVEIVDATGLTGQVAQYSATYDTFALDLHGTRARLQQAPVFPGNRTKPTALDIFAGNFTDDGEDRILVSTVWLLGPEIPMGEKPGQPDGTWTAHPQHHLFWNAMYASRYEPPARPPAPIRLTTGLALADTLGNQMLAPMNDLAQRLMAAFLNRNPEGAFYTV